MIIVAAIFSATASGDVLVAAEKPKKKALNWLMKFSAEKGRLLIYQVKDDWFAFGPPPFQAEVSERIARGESHGDIDCLVASQQRQRRKITIPLILFAFRPEVLNGRTPGVET